VTVPIAILWLTIEDMPIVDTMIPIAANFMPVALICVAPTTMMVIVVVLIVATFPMAVEYAVLTLRYISVVLTHESPCAEFSRCPCSGQIIGLHRIRRVSTVVSQK